MTLAVIVVYLLVVIAIGVLSNRLLTRTGEDWFLATRSIGPFMLLMSLFGTHMTSFSMLGASAEAYRRGIGVFGLMASSSALIAPVVFWFVGLRLWKLGKRHGYVTQVQFFRERFDSDVLGLVLFVVLIALLVPYLLIGVLGAGVTLFSISHGAVPAWAGSLAVCLVVVTYVVFGGLRGTAWANTFQTLVFMILGAVTFCWIVRAVGGLEAALDRAAAAAPEILVRGSNVSRATHLSYMVIPLSVGMFPHIFMHWLTARREATFRMPVIGYPICVAVVWLPSVLLGVVGVADQPGLAGPEASSILIRLIDAHAPGILAGFLAAGVFAAIMSSLDSQVLSLGTMFTQDVVRHYGFHDRMDEARQVLVGRLFVAAILIVTWVCSLFTSPAIFKLGVWSFTGFAGLFPIVVAALFWRRATAAGALGSVVTVAVLWVVFFVRAADVPGYTVGGSGVIPAAVILVASTAVLVLVSLVTRPPAAEIVARFHDVEPA